MSRSPRLPWTEEDYALLRRLLAAHASISEAARVLGRSYAAVSMKMSHHGLRVQPLRPQIDRALAESILSRSDPL